MTKEFNAYDRADIMVMDRNEAAAKYEVRASSAKHAFTKTYSSTAKLAALKSYSSTHC